MPTEKNLVKKKKVVQEILDSEKAYVEGLQIVVEVSLLGFLFLPLKIVLTDYLPLISLLAFSPTPPYLSRL